MWDVIGLLLAVVGIVLQLRPPTNVSDRRMHMVYIGIMCVIAVIFGYFVFESRQQVAVLTDDMQKMKAQAEEKDKLSNQAHKLYESLPNSNTSTCAGNVLSASSFLEKWKEVVPDTYQRTKVMADRVIEPVKEYSPELFTQRADCERLGEASKQLIEGLGGVTLRSKWEPR